MSVLAILLIGIGAGDVVRRRNLWLPSVVGLGAMIAMALLSGLWHCNDALPLVIAAVACAGWLVLGSLAEDTGSRQSAPLLTLGLGVTVLILLSGMASDVAGAVARWAEWTGLADGVPPDGVLMVAGVMLIQVATANRVVRLVLGSVGAVRPIGEPQASDQLKGGRLLGPMERLLIVGLGLAGQLTMASAVVAAKSIIRFPEISAKRARNGAPERVGIDDVTEYFLVGSFTSWMIAFGSLALVAATR